MNQRTLPQVFKQCVQKYGDRVAMRKKEYGLWHDISWSEYYRKVQCIGSALLSMGLEKGDRVSIIGDNCPEWVIIDMATQCAGGVSVGIYSTNAWPQVEYVVENSESKFLFAENEEQLDKWLNFRDKPSRLQKVIVWDLEGLRHFEDEMVMTYEELLEAGRQIFEKEPTLLENRMDEITPDNLALLIYTSGTTGPPKGAMLTHGNITWMGEVGQNIVPVEEGSEVLSYLPLCHIFERLFSVIFHVTYGTIVNFIENVDTVTDNMREISPTIGYAVPRIWEKYLSAVYIRMSDATWFKKLVFYMALKIGQRRTTLKMQFKPVPYYLEALYQLAHFIVFRKLKERLGFDRMKVAVTAAAPISQEVIHFFQSIGVNFIEAYGQTEGTGVTTISRLGKLKLGKVGTPIDGVEVRLAEDGEILVKSPGVFKGYYKQPEASAEALKDGWLHSGDVGEFDEDGYLKITDRKKDIMVTAGGKNIAPQYIENQLKFSTYINDAVIIGDNRKFITALIMIDEENVVKYAQDNKIQFSTYKDLTQDPDIMKLIGKEVDKVNAGLSRVEQIKKFTILPKRLYEEDGEVTPTMKVKRTSINEQFADLIDAMYKRV